MLPVPYPASAPKPQPKLSALTTACHGGSKRHKASVPGTPERSVATWNTGLAAGRALSFQLGRSRTALKGAGGLQPP